MSNDLLHVVEYTYLRKCTYSQRPQIQTVSYDFICAHNPSKARVYSLLCGCVRSVDDQTLRYVSFYFYIVCDEVYRRVALPTLYEVWILSNKPLHLSFLFCRSRVVTY